MNGRKFLVTGLGTGYLPMAPGTWGSLVPCGVYVLLAWLTAGNSLVLILAMLALALAASVVCVSLGPFAEKAFGKKDPGKVTVDEWAGQSLALIALPIEGGWEPLAISVGVAFFLFRLADVLKPPPARAMEKLPHGWGVLLDDLVAGVYANVAAQLLLRLWLLA